KAPFHRLVWRQALAGSVNREALTRLLPGFRAAFSYIPSSIEGYARMEVKLPPGEKEKPKAELVYPNTATAHLLLQRLQEDWRKAGWEIKLEPMEWKAYLSRLAGGAP